MQRLINVRIENNAVYLRSTWHAKQIHLKFHLGQQYEKSFQI